MTEASRESFEKAVMERLLVAKIYIMRDFDHEFIHKPSGVPDPSCTECHMDLAKATYLKPRATP